MLDDLRHGRLGEKQADAVAQRLFAEHAELMERFHRLDLIVSMRCVDVLAVKFVTPLQTKRVNEVLKEEPHELVETHGCFTPYTASTTGRRLSSLAPKLRHAKWPKQSTTAGL